MSITKFSREEILEVLLKFDSDAKEALNEEYVNAEMIIVGGSAFILLELTQRETTYDIDYYKASPSLTDVLEKYPVMNGQFAAHSNSLPYNFEDRLVELNIGSKFVNYFVPSLEDLVITKIRAWREPDITDITSINVTSKLNWKKLFNIATSIEECTTLAAQTEQYKEMIYCLKEFAKINNVEFPKFDEKEFLKERYKRGLVTDNSTS